MRFARCGPAGNNVSRVSYPKDFVSLLIVGAELSSDVVAEDIKPPAVSTKLAPGK
jgi:hypothetical protein